MLKRGQIILRNRQIVRSAQLAMLAALSVVLVLILRIPFGFLEYDMADVPILLGGMIYGPVAGLTILLVVSVVQAFLLGGNGWVGLVMHFVASGVMVVIVSLFYRHRKNLKETILGLVLGTLAMTLIMIPMNLVLTVEFLGAPRQVVIDMLVPLIIPFNLGKAGVNCLLAGLLLKALTPFLNKNRQLLMLD